MSNFVGIRLIIPCVSQISFFSCDKNGAQMKT